MSIMFVLDGVQAENGKDERLVASLKITVDGVEYDWMTFAPANVPDLLIFLEETAPILEAEIRYKEAKWAALNPKTRVEIHPMTGETVTVNMAKSEVVRPENPDYYARRRQEYPAINEQLDALWKGPNSQAFLDMEAKIKAVKEKYPKPNWTI